MSQKQFRLRRAFARIFLTAASLFILLPPVQPVLAQEQPGCVSLNRVDAARFPEVRLYFNACNSGGGFLEGLTPADVSVLEDDRPVQLQDLAVLQPGLESVLALNFSPEFTRVSSDGAVPYETLVQSLAGWYEQQPDGSGDSFSLAANTGLQVIRSTSGAEVAAALRGLQPDFERSEASMISLTQSLDLAADPENDPLKKKLILYITALPAEQNRQALANLTERAVQAGVRVQVWLVGPARSADTPIGQQLAELAFQTGGSLFTFSGSETLPAVDEYFQPLRFIYAARYLSQVNTDGAHQVGLTVNRPDGAVASAPAAYSIQLQAPNPIFLAPPANVDRTWVVGADKLPALSPAVLPLNILIEFGDGHPRTLQKVELLVDGEVVFTRTSAPFDGVEWPLDAVTASGQHLLQVRAEDVLGFSAASIELPVEVRVQIQPRQGLLASNSTQRIVIAAILVVTAGVLVTILLLAGKRGWRPLRIGRKERLWKDPVSQPVVEKKRVSNAPVTTLPRAAYGVAVSAVLVTLDADGNPDHEQVVEISRTEMTFGRDGRRVVCQLDDPSIAGLHARLLCTPDGRYNLTDCGSAAGTWVNYELAPGEGFDLKHGDRVNFGRTAFRFELAEPGTIAQPVIEPYEEDAL